MSIVSWRQVHFVSCEFQMQEYNSFYEGLGGGGFGWRGGGFGGFGGGSGNEGVTNTQVINIPVGTLVVDMYDRPKRQLVFRGMASDTLSGNEDKNSKNRISMLSSAGARPN